MGKQCFSFRELLLACLLFSISSCGLRETDQPISKSGYIEFNGERIRVTYQDFDERHVTVWGDVLIERDKILASDSSDLSLSSPGNKNGAVVMLWPSARVPYVLPANFPAAWQGDWDFMVTEWKKAGITWVPRLASDTSYVEVRLAKGLPDWVCGNSLLGRVPNGPTIMNLRDPSEILNCKMRRTILHEAAHALGFMHEHQRSDRDKFIKSAPSANGIDPAQLAIIPNSLASGSFDISSITLYSGAFLKLDGSVIPAANALSSGDIAGAIWRYQSQIQTDKPAIEASVKPGEYLGKLSVTGPAAGESYAYSMVFNPPMFPVEIKGDQVFYLGPVVPEPGVHEVWVEARSSASGMGLLHPVRFEVLPRNTATAVEINQTTAISCRTCLPFIRTYGQGDGTEWKAPVSMWFYPRVANTDKFEWRFADGVTAKTNVVIREFKTPGNFEIFVKVTNASGQIKEERYAFRIN
jgi:hypothetical protein